MPGLTQEEQQKYIDHVLREVEKAHELGSSYPEEKKNKRPYTDYEHTMRIVDLDVRKLLATRSVEDYSFAIYTRTAKAKRDLEGGELYSEAMRYLSTAGWFVDKDRRTDYTSDRYKIWEKVYTQARHVVDEHSEKKFANGEEDLNTCIAAIDRVYDACIATRDPRRELHPQTGTLCKFGDVVVCYQEDEFNQEYDMPGDQLTTSYIARIVVGSTKNSFILDDGIGGYGNKREEETVVYRRSGKSLKVCPPGQIPFVGLHNNKPVLERDTFTIDTSGFVDPGSEPFEYCCIEDYGKVRQDNKHVGVIVERFEHTLLVRRIEPFWDNDRHRSRMTFDWSQYEWVLKGKIDTRSGYTPEDSPCLSPSLPSSPLSPSSSLSPAKPSRVHRSIMQWVDGEHTTGFSAIYATDNADGMSRDGAIPWENKEDLAFFRDMTTNGSDIEKGVQNAVIMGRRTWESLPEKSKPLPGRLNIVLSTRDTPITSTHAHDVSRGRHKCKCMGTTTTIAGSKTACGGALLFYALEEALAYLETPQVKEKINDVFVIGGADTITSAVALDSCRCVIRSLINGTYECDTFAPPIDDSNWQRCDASCLKLPPFVQVYTRKSCTPPQIVRDKELADGFRTGTKLQDLYQEARSKYTPKLPFTI
jgi:dihydrofolate reductase